MLHGQQRSLPSQRNWAQPRNYHFKPPKCDKIIYADGHITVSIRNCVFEATFHIMRSYLLSHNVLPLIVSKFMALLMYLNVVWRSLLKPSVIQTVGFSTRIWYFAHIKRNVTFKRTASFTFMYVQCAHFTSDTIAFMQKRFRPNNLLCAFFLVFQTCESWHVEKLLLLVQMVEVFFFSLFSRFAYRKWALKSWITIWMTQNKQDRNKLHSIMS